MDILKTFLKKRNVDDFSQLTEEEKETYREWDIVLSGRKLTDEDVIKFLDEELAEVQFKIVNPDQPQRTFVFLQMKLEFINKLKFFLSSPQTEKETLERNIKNQI